MDWPDQPLPGFPGGLLERERPVLRFQHEAVLQDLHLEAARKHDGGSSRSSSGRIVEEADDPDLRQPQGTEDSVQGHALIQQDVQVTLGAEPHTFDPFRTGMARQSLPDERKLGLIDGVDQVELSGTIGALAFSQPGLHGGRIPPGRIQGPQYLLQALQRERLCLGQGPVRVGSEVNEQQQAGEEGKNGSLHGGLLGIRANRVAIDRQGIGRSCPRVP